MTISPDVVRKMANLAALDVGPSDLGQLAAELDAIVNYVGQLSAPIDGGIPAPFLAGPAVARLRPDVVQPAPLAHPIAGFAPAFVDGFFVVPRHPALEGE